MSDNQKVVVRSKDAPSFASIAQASKEAYDSKQTQTLEAKLKAISDYADFLEECLVEMATLLYSME